MIGKIKKGIFLSVGLASLVKKEADKHINSLVKSGKIKTDGAKKIVNAVVLEAKKEGKNIENFLFSEIKKEAEKVKPIVKSRVKKAIKKVKNKIR
jgi:polyhydroxyalkanoate synthesis regulator phasin